MELEKAILNRTSIRSFTEEDVSEEDVDKLLRAGMSAPSAVNRQPWEFYVVRDPEKRAALRKVGFTNYASPLMIVLAGNVLRMLPLKMSEFWAQDCSAATENILLEATSLGLGAVWCGVHPNKTREKQIRSILGAGLTIVPFNIIVVGHPKGDAPKPKDKFDPKKIHLL